MLVSWEKVLLFNLNKLIQTCFWNIKKRGGEVKLGKMHVVETNSFFNPKYIINFPTKGHWRSQSRMKDIESGLMDLIKVVKELNIKSIAVPPLGCGNGGLKWV